MTAVTDDAPRTRIPAEDAPRPRMLFVPYQGTHMLELLRLARVMRERGSFDIAFCVGAHAHEGRRIAGIIGEAGFTVLDLAAPPKPINFPGGHLRRAMSYFRNRVMRIDGYRRRCELVEAEELRDGEFTGISFREKLKRRVASFGAYFPMHVAVAVLSRVANSIGAVRIFDFFTRTARELQRIRHFMVSRQVSLLVFCEDNVEMGVPLWIRAARDLEVPSVVVPFTIANAREPYESYRDQREHQVRARALNMVAAWAFPKWQARYKGKRFLRATGDRIITLELLRCSPPNPWIMNSGYATAIAAESPAMVAYCRACGIPEEQLVLTGCLADDIMYVAQTRREASRDELARHLGFERDWPIVLCAFPPNQLGARPHPDFANYFALWRSYLESLNKIGLWNIVIRLHPRTALSEIDQEALGRAAICDWDTAALVPLCDLYVSTVSATIRWAIACGTPVINYDVYDYRYADYAAVENVFTSADRRGFEAELLRLTGNPAALEAARRGQLKAAPSWGLIDGRSGQRLAELFERLVATPKKGALRSETA